jgi:hypothetical protein
MALKAGVLTVYNEERSFGKHQRFRVIQGAGRRVMGNAANKKVTKPSLLGNGCGLYARADFELHS